MRVVPDPVLLTSDASLSECWELLRDVNEISQNSIIFGEGHEDTILKRCLSIVSPLEIRTLVWKVDHLLRSSGKGKGRG